MIGFEGRSDKSIIRRARRRLVRHYHVIDNRIGDPLGYRDDVFSSRREAEATARSRAEWLAMGDLQVQALTGSGAT